MHLVLSGEGPTDLGLFSLKSCSFVPGAMYYIADKIIKDKYFEYKNIPWNSLAFPSVSFALKKFNQLNKKLPIFHVFNKD